MIDMSTFVSQFLQNDYLETLVPRLRHCPVPVRQFGRTQPYYPLPNVQNGFHCLSLTITQSTCYDTFSESLLDLVFKHFGSHIDI